MGEKVTIGESELKKLRRQAAKLEALEAGGVDNWEWYGESIKEYNATIQREEDLEILLHNICAVLFSHAYEPSERGAGWTSSDQGIKEAFEILDKHVATLKDAE